MESRGWTSFCYSGHIIEQCPPGVFLINIKDGCPYCGRDILGSIPGWGLEGSESSISVLPIGVDKVRYKNVLGKMVDSTIAVYGVERLRIFVEK